MKKKGFTLVELLAVIVVLAIILVIAIPNVLGIINKARNDSFLSTARMMATAARTRVASDPTLMPTGNLTAKAIALTALDLENISKDPDGGTYGTNSYVYVVKDSTGAIRYFVTLQGSKRAINHVEEPNIQGATTGDTDTADTVVASGSTVTLGGETYTVE